MSDETPDPLQALSEMIAAMATLATSARSYYVALRSEGFTEQQAMLLVTCWQSDVISGGMQ